MRLFVALQLDDKVNKQLISIMHEVKKRGVRGNYVPAQNLHLTLTFIGETDQLPRIKEVLANVPVPEMRISLDGSGFFGNTFWIGVKGNQKLKGYVNNVRKALDSAGIDYDHKAFEPHITLIRKATGNLKGLEIPKAECTVKKTVLLKSETTDGKLVYKKMEEF